MLCETNRLAINPIRALHYSPGQSVYYSLVNKENGQSVGYVCFQDLDLKEGTCNLAYKTYEYYRKKGYMKEALPVVIRHIFEVLPLITINIVIEKINKASIETVKYIPDLIEKKNSNDHLKFIVKRG